jgi:hypothetical protein
MAGLAPAIFILAACLPLESAFATGNITADFPTIFG